MVRPIPDIDKPLGKEVAELSEIPIDLNGEDWLVKVVPQIGGRIISMTHLPSGIALIDLYYFLLVMPHTMWLEIDNPITASGRKYKSFEDMCQLNFSSFS